MLGGNPASRPLLRCVRRPSTPLSVTLVVTGHPRSATTPKGDVVARPPPARPPDHGLAKILRRPVHSRAHGWAPRARARKRDSSAPTTRAMGSPVSPRNASNRCGSGSMFPAATPDRTRSLSKGSSRHSPVDDQRMAGQKTRCLAGEVHGAPGDLVGGPVAAHGCSLENMFEKLIVLQDGAR